MAKTYFVSEFDGEKTVHEFPENVTMGEFFFKVSKAISFSDCSGENIEEIVFRDEDFEYQGWRPGELFIYIGSEGSTWDGCYPEFDH